MDNLIDQRRQRGAQEHCHSQSLPPCIFVSLSLCLYPLSSLFPLSSIPFVFSLTRSGEKVRGIFRFTEVSSATILLLRVSSPPTFPRAFVSLTPIWGKLSGVVASVAGVILFVECVCLLLVAIPRNPSVRPKPWPSIGLRMNYPFP